MKLYLDFQNGACVLAILLLQTVQRGDVLYVRVASHFRDLLSIVKVQAAVGATVRDLFDADIKVCFLFNSCNLNTDFGH